MQTPFSVGLITDNLHLRLFEAQWVKIDTLWNTPDVRSPFWRFYWNESEGAAVQLSRGAVALQAHRAYFIPAGVPFSCANTATLLHFYVHFDVIGLPTPTLRALFADIIPLPASPRQSETLVCLQREMAAETAPSFATQCRIKALLYEEMAVCWRSLPPEALERCGQLTARLQPVLPAIERIEAELSGSLPLAELASLCAFSVNHFIRLFRHCVGTTPAHYIQEKRIVAASQRLLFSQESIETIAEQTGFANRFYLTRVFTRHTGVSPAAYRRMVRPR